MSVVTNDCRQTGTNRIFNDVPSMSLYAIITTYCVIKISGLPDSAIPGSQPVDRTCATPLEQLHAMRQRAFTQKKQPMKVIRHQYPCIVFDDPILGHTL